MWTFSPFSLSRAEGISAPVGQAWTHSPQATQVDWPIGSAKSNTMLDSWPRAAMPITSLTWTSRQARTQRLQWMQASRLTAMAGWLESGAGGSARAGKRDAPVPTLSAQVQNALSGSWLVGRAGWSATSSSNTSSRALKARSDPDCTTMPWRGLRMHDAASTRSPSISTMQARQLPSGR